MTNAPTTPMTITPFRPTNPDADIPVVWANNEAEEFPPAWWAEMSKTLYELTTHTTEYLNDDDVSLELAVSIALSEVATRVVKGTNPGGPNTAHPGNTTLRGEVSPQARAWGVMKKELPAAVRYVRKLRRNASNVAAYAPTALLR